MESTSPLSKRELQVCQLIAEGLSAREMARELGLRPHTIRSYTKAAYAKLGIHKNTELALAYDEPGVTIVEWRKLSPVQLAQRLRCYQLFRKALKIGWLDREPCACCGDPRTDGHHEDYNEPLKVVWLCKDHHRARHRELRA